MAEHTTPSKMARVGVSLNNQAASRIQRCEYALAALELATAVHTFGQLLQKQRCDGEHGSKYGGQLSPTRFPSPLRFTAEEYSSDHSYDHQVRYLWKRPLEIQNLFQDINRSCHLFAYASVFNLALCYHLQGCSNDQKRSAARQEATRLRALKMAVRLYSNAAKLLNAAMIDFSSRSRSMHCIVIWNNMSHAYECLGDNDASTECLQKLARAMSSLLCFSPLGRSSLVEIEEDDIPLEGFWTSILMIFVGCNQPSVAGAA